MNAELQWVRPQTIYQLLDGSIWDAIQKPPHSNSAYLVSLKEWSGKPTKECEPLYIGSTTGKSDRFRARMGDLIADLFGFFNPEGPGHSSGGKALHKFCKEKLVRPFELYISWVDRGSDCHRCLEVDLVRELEPALNHNAPPRCLMH